MGRGEIYLCCRVTLNVVRQPNYFGSERFNSAITKRKYRFGGEAPRWYCVPRTAFAIDFRERIVKKSCTRRISATRALCYAGLRKGLVVFLFSVRCDRSFRIVANIWELIGMLITSNQDEQCTHRLVMSREIVNCSRGGKSVMGSLLQRGHEWRALSKSQGLGNEKSILN